MLKKIKIQGLFGKFDYEIELKQEGLTILTGPNGYGKTTILKIFDAVANADEKFFKQLPFQLIVLEDDGIKISKAKGDLNIIRPPEDNTLKKDAITQLQEEWPERFSSLLQIADNLWCDQKTGAYYTIKDLEKQFIAAGVTRRDASDAVLQLHLIISLLPFFRDIYFIKEQRLIRRSKNSHPREAMLERSVSTFEEYIKELNAREAMPEHFTLTIEEYTKELARILNGMLAYASKLGQELDSSFPKRLFDETNGLSEEEFKKRYDVIQDKQKALQSYGLSKTTEDSRPFFKPENAKALLVYLNDTEKKLAVFDPLLQKLQVFASILNDRAFAFKKLQIAPEFGFKFQTEDGQEITLSNLSSGEQQTVVVWYELIFRAKPNTLVLIDEPEISLHVAWQKEMIRDLLKIVQLQKLKIIIATHSPQIIGIYWDLVVDLYDLSKGCPHDYERLPEEEKC